MYIKLDDLTIPDNMILKDTYIATPKNVYKSAKRSQGKSLKMIKVLLGAVYEIKFTLNHMKMTKEFVSELRKVIMRPEINVEFYDDYSASYKIQNCYCQDTEAKIKVSKQNDSKILYNNIPLVFTSNQSADWIN